jgi:small multidrug resistance pump
VTAALLLLGAVASQVLGIGALRASDGMRSVAWAATSLIAIAVSVALMAQAMNRGLSLAIGYGIWSGAGIALSALGGAVLFGDRLLRRQVAGLVVVLVGVVLVRTGS